MQLGAFTADVLVDGKLLEQYDVTFESPTKVTCWVASEEGKSFSIQLECHEASRSTDHMGFLRVDGIRCGTKRMPAGSLGVKSKAVLSQFIGETTKRELMFARLQLSDDDSLLNEEIPKMLGEICLTVRHGNIVKKRKRRVISNQDLSMFDGKKFHERSKKATVHCVGFGLEMARTPTLFRRRLIPNDDPELTFVFKYQPLSVLQANGIAPRPTSNGANPNHEISSSQLTTADDPAFGDIKPARLNDRIQCLENELKRLRDLQGSNSEDQKPQRVKREEQSRPLFAPGEIIDLT